MLHKAKQGVFQSLVFWGMCILMCGAFIGVLISSGWLVLLVNEGQNKIFLIPLLAFLVCVYFFYKHRKKKALSGLCCATKSFKAINMVLYLLISLLISALFMLYIFIPWWLPNYKGGPLLP